MTEHAVTQVAGAAQPGLHLGSEVGAALCCLNRCENCVTRCFRSLGLLQCFDEGVERIQHGPIAGFRATQFADCLAGPEPVHRPIAPAQLRRGFQGHCRYAKKALRRVAPMIRLVLAEECGRVL